jgi:hypothetical protein
MKKPILLLRKDLLDPIENALNRLEKIRRRKASNQDKIILEGIFTLAVSSFENSINDTLRVLFKAMPGKLPFKEKQIDKKSLINNSVLIKTIEKQIASLSYANIEEILQEFIECTDIEIGIEELPNDNLNKIKEIKATRNLLLHNNLVVNNIYLEKAGPLQRSKNLGNKLSIDQEYLYQSILTLKETLEFLKEKLDDKYQNFTRLRATKKLFEFMFPTPIMIFENEFKVDKENDKILAYNKEESIYKNNSLSSSEEMLFDIWLSHLYGPSISTNWNFYKLDKHNREKLQYFMFVVELLKTG